MGLLIVENMRYAELIIRPKYKDILDVANTFAKGREILRTASDISVVVTDNVDAMQSDVTFEDFVKGIRLDKEHGYVAIILFAYDVNANNLERFKAMAQLRGIDAMVEKRQHLNIKGALIRYVNELLEEPTKFSKNPQYYVLPRVEEPYNSATGNFRLESFLRRRK